MRGEQKKQSSMLVLMSPESVVPKDHPARRIKKFADQALGELSPTFDAMYAAGGRPSIPPERLLKSMLLIALYSVRSERMFCERLNYDLLARLLLLGRAPGRATALLAVRQYIRARLPVALVLAGHGFRLPAT